MTRSLIVGVGGQDGAYLAQRLLASGYHVTGTSRQSAVPGNLDMLGIAGIVMLRTVDPGDRASVAALIAETVPDEIYWLAAQTSVAASFDEPAAGLAAAADLASALAAARAHAPAARFLFAASGECFGETTQERPAREDTAFAPLSPYAVGKCAGALAIRQAREAHGQFACSAYLFTHESPLRPERFVVAKIAAAARRIAAGSTETLGLGDVSVVRDWGWAPEHVAAMHAMLTADEPRDLIVATGTSVRLADLVEEAFAAIGRDWRDHVAIDAVPPRPGDARSHHARPSLAAATIGWCAGVDARAMMRRLVLGAIGSEGRPT
ncbi:GDP-mannose 4,6-dehydratase [Sphingomonas sp.]|uniref:GDP-mannose 4,6-dehydratase n=1 Tax=Sphingomonas sp. TaxID=28214 RepID=UPI003AFFFDB2